MSSVPEPTPAATTPVSPGASGEWEERTLCPDDSCIGVLGPDGRCCLCGLRGDLSRPRHTDSASSRPSIDEAAESDAVATDDADDADDDAGAEATATNNDGDDAFSHRELCSNDSCIGVLSASGVCPLCGSQRSEH